MRKHIFLLSLRMTSNGNTEIEAFLRVTSFLSMTHLNWRAFNDLSLINFRVTLALFYFPFWVSSGANFTRVLIELYLHKRLSFFLIMSVRRIWLNRLIHLHWNPILEVTLNIIFILCDVRSKAHAFRMIAWGSLQFLMNL